MKNIIYLVLIASILSNCSIRNKITGQTEYIGSSESGTILLKSIGIGSTKNEAILNAEIRAFENLIFKGIPGSQYSLPMIENEKESKQKHSFYYTKLLKDKNYQSFLLSSVTTSSYNVLLNNEININLKINVASLRKDLENNNIIRKFGL